MAERAVCLVPNGHPSKPGWLNNLGNSLSSRFQYLADFADLDKSIRVYEEAVNLTPNGRPHMLPLLTNLASSLLRRFERIGDPVDINRSVTIAEKAANLAFDDHPQRPNVLNNLGNSLARRFQSLGDLTDIKKSVSIFEEVARLTPTSHYGRPIFLKNLGNAYMEHFRHTGTPSSLAAAALQFSLASQSPTGPTSTRFYAARNWVSSAQMQGNSQAVLDAYTTTINLLPELAWLGLSLKERHRVLLEAADIARDAAATALEAGLPEQAVEWLEQGRSIVWGQFLQLRTPVDELGAEHPDLAHQFQKISRDLEQASRRETSRTLYRSADSDELDNHSGSLEREVQRHHDLALTREKLLVKIRSLPGFDRFLLPKTIKQLAPLAHSGPVVYLNASRNRCDALIVKAELGNVIHVPLPDISYLEVGKLYSILRLLLKQNCLIVSRDEISVLVHSEESLSSRCVLRKLLGEGGTEASQRAVKVKPQRTAGYTSDELFQQILGYMWKEIVKPVLDAFGFLTTRSNSEKLTRIFWCPTGPFAFLPIHAAGLYGTAEPAAKLSDFAISSYIPTLGTLVPSSARDLGHSSSDIRLLTVPQPSTDGLTPLALVKTEIDQIRSLSIRSPYVALRDSDGTVEDVMEKMKHSDWVHFACHGVQDQEDPLDSGLCLANGRRLKLSDIIRLSRPRGGLAFLSACQTAQGDEKLSEESVHLASGMLLAGYGSVIATMWAIQDPDALKVTSKVYEHLFRRDNGTVPNSMAAAEALHRAVQHLRDTGASFTSWVPFIHMGR